MGWARVINFAFGAANLPLEVLQKAAKGFVETNATGMSVAEMGYHATLQFAAIPLDLLGGVNEGKAANHLMIGHGSENTKNEAAMFGKMAEVGVDHPKNFC